MKTRITLVVLSLILSLLIGLTLKRGSGDNRTSTENRPLVIGFAMDTLKEERWQRDRDLFVARARELGAEVLVQSANSDDIRQLRDVESLISNHVDAIVIVPHDGAAMAKAVQLAHEANIPVLAYDRLITNSDLDLYVTFDNIRVGELQAEYLRYRFFTNRPADAPPIRLVRIYGAKTDNNARLFKQGQDNILAPLIASGQVEVVHEDWAENWKPENAKKILNAAITKVGRNFDAILASNDGTAGGAIQSLLEEGLAGKIVVTGQDADLAACQRIVAGTQAMTIYKPLHQLANQAAELAVKLAQGRPIIARHSVNNQQIDVPSILLEVTTVTKENIESTVIADGLHPRERIFGPLSMSAILQASAITKRFPGVVALDRVSFDLVPGEIHALCGENGAGKSTLIKLLSGLHNAGSFEGELFLDQKPTSFHRVADAQKSGIAVIHQELALVGELTVAENLFLGNERRRRGFLDWEKTWTDARELLAKVGLAISPDTLVRDLGIGQQQLVEIAKAIARDMRILILDEPTAALSEHEVQTLLKLLRELRDQGIACIYISHKLEEVFALADRITVLRDGATIATINTAETDKADIIRHMVGREISQLFPRHISHPGAEALRVSNLVVAPSADAKPFLNDLSLHVRAGEVLGIGGLMGAGRTELMMHLFGAWGHRLQGEIFIGDQSLQNRSPLAALEAGLALVSEDRKRYGLILDESIGFNF